MIEFLLTIIAIGVLLLSNVGRLLLLGVLAIAAVIFLGGLVILLCVWLWAYKETVLVGLAFILFSVVGVPAISQLSEECELWREKTHKKHPKFMDTFFPDKFLFRICAYSLITCVLIVSSFAIYANAPY